MSLTLEGTNRRILMPDGRYLGPGEVGGNLAGWSYLSDHRLVQWGQTVGGVRVTFGLAYTTVYNVVCCEANIGGWSDSGGGVGGQMTTYGVNAIDTTGFSTRVCLIRGGDNVLDPGGCAFLWMVWGYRPRP